MASIERLLDRNLDLPEDRRYHPTQGLWVQREGEELIFGLSEPAVVLAGGLKQVEPLAADGDRVEKGEAVVFAITDRIMYLDAPLSGTLSFHPRLRERPEPAVKAPYGDNWLFRIRPDGEVRTAYETFAEAQTYAETLIETKGRRNPVPRGHTRTGMCNAVYRGIRDGVSAACC